MEYHTQKVGDTVFQVLTRYQDLQAIGSGAQGVVMYVSRSAHYP